MSKTLLDSAGLQLYDSLIKGVAGGSLVKSADGKKLVLKSVDGKVLSECDAPSVDVDVSTLVPKTGNRGVLAGFNDCAHHIINESESAEITIDANSPDDMVIEVIYGGTLTLTFADSNEGAYVKNIFLLGDTEGVTVNFGDYVVVDTFMSNGYVNDLGLSFFNQIVVSAYDFIDEETPNVFVSNKVIA